MNRDSYTFVVTRELLARWKSRDDKRKCHALSCDSDVGDESTYYYEMDDPRCDIE